MADTDPSNRLVPAADQGALRASHADRDHRRTFWQWLRREPVYAIAA